MSLKCFYRLSIGHVFSWILIKHPAQYAEYRYYVLRTCRTGPCCFASARISATRLESRSKCSVSLCLWARLVTAHFCWMRGLIGQLYRDWGGERQFFRILITDIGKFRKTMKSLHDFAQDRLRPIGSRHEWEGITTCVSKPRCLSRAMTELPFVPVWHATLKVTQSHRCDKIA